MNKYRVLKSYPKQITNSGRLVTLKQGSSVYLKREPQILRLVNLGFIKQVVELPKRSQPAKPKMKARVEVKAEAKEEPEIKHKKNKGKNKDSNESN